MPRFQEVMFLEGREGVLAVRVEAISGTCTSSDLDDESLLEGSSPRMMQICNFQVMVRALHDTPESPNFLSFSLRFKRWRASVPSMPIFFLGFGKSFAKSLAFCFKCCTSILVV